MIARPIDYFQCSAWFVLEKPSKGLHQCCRIFIIIQPTHPQIIIPPLQKIIDVRWVKKRRNLHDLMDFIERAYLPFVNPSLPEIYCGKKIGMNESVSYLLKKTFWKA